MLILYKIERFLGFVEKVSLQSSWEPFPAVILIES